MINGNHFRSDLTAPEAAAIFKGSVKTVEIAISGYCNRRCSYCPNSKSDRISAPNRMSDDLFLSVLRQLRGIDYDGEISLHRYNEPLADRAYAMRRIGEIRAYLPAAKIIVFTNGDYLDADYVRELVAARVSRIVVTMHEAPNGTSYPDLLENQIKFVKRIGLPAIGANEENAGARSIILDVGADTQFIVWAYNFHHRDANGVLFMQDRGQSLDVQRGVMRSAPCFIPFVQMQIEWDGQLLPCCQIQPDVFEKDKYTLGRLTASSDIFLAWANVHYAKLRKELFSFEPKAAPCSTCNFGGVAQESPALRAKIGAMRRAMGLDAPEPAEALSA